MKKVTLSFLLLALCATAFAGTIDIRAWKVNEAAPDGWSVKKLIGTKAFGPHRKQIGKVENLIFDPEGKVRELIVTTGGFLGIDDTPLAVKWQDVKIGPERRLRQHAAHRGECQKIWVVRRYARQSRDRASRMASDGTHRRLCESKGWYPLRLCP